MTEYRFVLTPYDPSLADELSRALEKRTELSSRKKYPGLCGRPTGCTPITNEPETPEPERAEKSSAQY